MDGMLGCIRWKQQCKLRSLPHTMAGTGSKEKRTWCLYLKSDLREARKQTQNPQMYFKAPNSSLAPNLGKQKLIANPCQGSPVLTVSEPSNTVWGHPNVFVFVLLCFLPLFPKPIIVLSKLNHFFHLLADVYPLVFAILVCAGKAGRRWWMGDRRKKGKIISKRQQYWTQNW